jgi:hypothetical protein
MSIPRKPFTETKATSDQAVIPVLVVVLVRADLRVGLISCYQYSAYSFAQSVGLSGVPGFSGFGGTCIRGYSMSWPSSMTIGGSCRKRKISIQSEKRWSSLRNIIRPSERR